MHVFWCWIFVVHYDFEIVGVGIASTITNAIIYFTVVFYTSTLSDLKDAVDMKFMSKKTYQGFFSYLELGFPSAAMLMLEWWAYEGMTLLSGYLGVTE